MIGGEDASSGAFLNNAGRPHVVRGQVDVEVQHLRTRFVVLATGQGANEAAGESWTAAHELGSRGVPNRVDLWGPEWPHDWQTWRAMLPHYLDDIC